MPTHEPALEGLLTEFDAFCGRVRRRLIEGYQRYGESWRGRDNLAALLEESEDAFAYGFFDWLRARTKLCGGAPPPGKSSNPTKKEPK